LFERLNAVVGIRIPKPRGLGARQAETWHLEVFGANQSVEIAGERRERSGVSHRVALNDVISNSNARTDRGPVEMCGFSNP
jgi:hypothetical protein